MKANNSWPEPKNRLLLGIAINVAIIALWAGVHFVCLGNVDYWQTQIERQAELVVFGSHMTSFYFAGLGLAPVLLMVNIQLLYKDILKRELPKFATKIQNFLAGLLLLGLFLIITGGLFINPIWEARFQEAGFVECQSRVLNFRKAVFNDVWVRNANHCEDPRLRYILHEHFGRRGFALADQYLRELEKQSVERQR